MRERMKRGPTNEYASRANCTIHCFSLCTVLMLRFHFAVEALPEREPAREMLQGSLKRADLAIVEARERVQDLRNESAASKSLPETIESVARDLRVDDSVNFSILVEGHPRDFHPPVKEELCRIAHEALTNSFHHSKASRIEVGLDYSFARSVERVFIGDPEVSETVYRLLKAAREGKRQQEEMRVAGPRRRSGALAADAGAAARRDP